MARGRFISRKICDDHRVAQLPVLGQLLYERIIVNLDCEGRMHGDPKLVKGKCLPFVDCSLKQIATMLNKMSNLKKGDHGLIDLYKVNGAQYIWCEGFEGEQTGLRKDREAASEIPPPPNSMPTAPPKRAVSKTEEILDEKLKDIVICYEENIGMATPNIFERLKDISDTYPDGWFKDAVNEACVYGKRNLKYIETILERWQNEGKDSGKGKAKNKPAKAEEDTGIKVES